MRSVPIHELDRETIQHYLRELSDTVQRRIEAQMKPDLQKGRALLEQFELNSVY